VKQLKTGALIAMAVGGLFTSACKKEEKAGTEVKKTEVAPTPTPTPGSNGSAAVAVDPAKAEKPDEKTAAQVDCSGVNACKGQGTCKTEKHGCGGQNACKGQGVLTMSESDCNAKGGTITARK
jgi:hypothetical protein